MAPYSVNTAVRKIADAGARLDPRAPDLRLVPEYVPPPPPASGPAFKREPYVRRRQLGALLLEDGAVDRADLARALIAQRSLGGRLGTALLRAGAVSEARLTHALGRQYAMGTAGPAPEGDAEADALARRLPAELALRHNALPWRRIGGLVLIATSDPAGVAALRAELPPGFGPCMFAVVPPSVLQARIGLVHGGALARRAECRPPEELSCRRLNERAGAVILSAALLSVVLAVMLSPAAALRWLTGIGLVVAVANTGLRAAATWAARDRGVPVFISRRSQVAAEAKLPRMSILVPLHNEPDIAAPLTERLSRLEYPRALLEVALVVEAGDTATRDALALADLPPWMRVIAVPDGHPRTKPRAMNYALDFVDGDVVGIYDAEDAPAPDQLRRVAARFAAAPARMACLQGQLDYYNPRLNWMARCFTIEYAGWFRQMLPGIARLGLVVPLGGTTVFFRRAPLERVGGWDAHNVTEDADLGVRLARMGYRTEVIETTTLEEANAAPIAWVKQRSRWMKGYVLTWAVHTATPVKLWRDLGPKRFLGFHLQFMGAILNALLTPAMWTLLPMTWGWRHPIMDWLPAWGGAGLTWGVCALTLVSLWLTVLGCSAPHHRHLRAWVPATLAYFPLASLAVIKALKEIALNPFHWDKTTHGQHGGTEASAQIAALEASLSGRPARAAPGVVADPPVRQRAMAAR